MTDAEFKQDKGESLVCIIQEEISSFAFSCKDYSIKFELLLDGNYALNLPESDLEKIIENQEVKK